MGKTKIEWTRGDDGSEGRTWNPIRARHKATGAVGWHCEHASEGCRNCYSEALNLRLGTKLPFAPTSKREVEMFLDRKVLEAPLRWRDPCRVFVCSMTDLFADFVPDEWIDRVFAVMAASPLNTFIVLTKRAERMRDHMKALGSSFARLKAACPPGWSFEYEGFSLVPWPLPNVWLGVSAEAQREADLRVPPLLETPAAIRHVSLEPLLGPINMKAFLPALSWGIVGGESGRNARPCSMRWVLSMVRQFDDARRPLFLKQLGARPCLPSCADVVCTHPDCDPGWIRLKDRKGGDPGEWPRYLTERGDVRQFPKEATK